MSFSNKKGPDELGALASEAEGVAEPPAVVVSPRCPSCPSWIPADEQTEAGKGK